MNTLSFIELLRGEPLTEAEKAKVLEDLRGAAEPSMTSSDASDLSAFAASNEDKDLLQGSSLPKSFGVFHYCRNAKCCFHFSVTFQLLSINFTFKNFVSAGFQSPKSLDLSQIDKSGLQSQVRISAYDNNNNSNNNNDNSEQVIFNYKLL